MPTFLIEWSDEIENAKTPLEAVTWAFRSIRDEDSLYFTVTNLKTDEKWGIDLLDDNNITELNND